ncbi:centromeric protein E [Nematocida major]|uniref:centromeric protein E n=1 Tax=Nematocida major TaxID=1912982 RepID=UPI002007FD28|nr:centromeric protein E [Nematocida major]KAH9386865.1 centromeric protein E [Nematocida major]
MEGNHRVMVAMRVKPPGVVDAPCPHADEVFSHHTNTQIYNEFVKKHTASIAFSTIFTYGRTGSGKTYTMFGDKCMPGIAELILIDALDAHKVLSVRCIEIYNEVATDLFTGTPIRIVQESNATRIISETQITIKSHDEIVEMLDTIRKKRKTSETEHNMESSRSHTVIEVNAVDLAINLVDLAGNEKMAENIDRRKEGMMINKSLLTLGKVIDQLHTDTLHVSYRESKLTRILQNTLSYGTIVCMCTVIDLSDHLTIKFAERLKRIKTSERPVVKSKDEIIHDLVQKVAYLTEQLQKMALDSKEKSPAEAPCMAAGDVSEEETVADIHRPPARKALVCREEGSSAEQEKLTAVEVIKRVGEQEKGPICNNLYELIYRYLKGEVEQEMANTLTSQEMNQVHVTFMQQKRGLLHGTPFQSIFKLSRTELRDKKSKPSSAWGRPDIS